MLKRTQEEMRLAVLTNNRPWLFCTTVEWKPSSSTSLTRALLMRWLHPPPFNETTILLTYHNTSLILTSDKDFSEIYISINNGQYLPIASSHWMPAKHVWLLRKNRTLRPSFNSSIRKSCPRISRYPIELQQVYATQQNTERRLVTLRPIVRVLYGQHLLDSSE